LPISGPRLETEISRILSRSNGDSTAIRGTGGKLHYAKAMSPLCLHQVDIEIKKYTKDILLLCDITNCHMT